MATGGPVYRTTKETENYERVCRALVDLSTDVYRDVLMYYMFVEPIELWNEVNACPDLKHKLPKDEQMKINYSVHHSTISNMDLSLLYKLIRSISDQNLRLELDKRIQASNIWTKVQADKVLLSKLSRVQEDKVKRASSIGNYSECDCLLLSTLLDSLCSGYHSKLVPTSNRWSGSPPQPSDIKLGDDIERIRILRNSQYGHVSDTCIPDADFQNIWTELIDIMSRMDTELQTGGYYSTSLAELEKANLDGKWEEYESKIKKLIKNVKSVQLELQKQHKDQERTNHQVTTLSLEQRELTEKQEDIAQQVATLNQKQKDTADLDEKIQIQMTSLDTNVKVRNLQEHITAVKQLWDASKELFEEIKKEHLIEKVDNKLRELERNEDRWDKSIESAVKLEKELQGSQQYNAEPFTTDALENELQRIQPCKDFKYLQYLQDAQKPEHEHNIHRVIDAASKEIKLKKEVRNLLNNITTAKQLLDASKALFEEIKTEHLLEEAENKLRELERKEDRWDKSIESAVKLEKELQGSWSYDAEPFTADALEKELQRIQPSTDFKYLQYLQDAQKPEHKHNIHRVINAASKEIGLKKEEIGPRKLDDWRKSDKTFYPTNATSLISEKIKSKKKVVAFGLPGSGKTAAIRHIALRLKNEGHRLCCVQTFSELKCKMYKFGEKEKQVYVIDDVFGVHGVDELKRKQWCDDNKDEVERCLNNPNISILCSSRMQVLSHDKLNTIKSRFSIVNISEGECELSRDEQAGIFRNHAVTKQRNNLLTKNKDQLKDDIKEKVREVKCPVGCFPLVCHLYTGDTEPKQTIDEYFNKPLHIIADHLEKLKVEDRLSHFCLLLCLIYENKLPVNIMKVGKEEEETKNKREELLEICELPATTLRTTIKNKMETLLQTFVKREGDEYQFVHDIVHDAVIKHIGTFKADVLEVILRHCKVLLCVACDRRCDTEVVQALIDAGTDVNTQDVNGRTSLWLSVIRGDYETTQLLLNHKADVNLCDEDGLSALQLSVYKDDYKTTQLLLDHKADVNLCTNRGVSALFRSVYKGDYKTTQLLLDHKADVNLCDNQGWSVLYLFVCEGDYKTTQFLLDHKADVNLCTNQGWSALYQSVHKGDYKTTQLLLDHKADVNLCDEDGWSALYLSVYKGDYKTTQLLLDHKADVNLCEKERGWSALYLSVDKGDYKTTQLLLDHKADVNLCDIKGWSALCRSVYIGDYKTTQLLLDHGADVNLCTNQGWSALYQSVYNGDYKTTQLLLNHKADVNLCTNKGWSALYLSVDKGDYKTTQLLLDHKADVNLCDEDDRTALYMSVYNGDYETTKLLLNCGANVNLCEIYGRSPCYLSQIMIRDTITELLHSHDAVCLYKGTQYNHVTDVPDLPLCDCIEYNNYQAVKMLIDRGNDVNQCDNECGWSPLFISQVMEHENITSLLMSRDAVCQYKGKHYNHVTDIPDCEVDETVAVLIGDEFVAVQERIQELKEKQKVTK